MDTAILLSAGLLLAGFALRRLITPLARLHIPGALVAGALGLLLLQFGEHLGDTAAGVVASARPQWVAWRDLLVPVIFAALLLERPGTGAARPADEARATAQQALAAWVIILGQLAVGLLVAVVVLRPLFGVPAHFGQLLEVSWAGGFGSSSAWGQQHEAMAGGAAGAAFADARDFAVFFTTAGLVWGVISGVVLVNVGIRRGWTAAGRPAGDGSARVDAIPATRPAAPERPATSTGLDGLTLQLIWLVCAFGLGMLMQRGSTLAVAGLPAGHLLRQSLDKLPLFLFTLLGGWAVRRALTLLGHAKLIDNDLLGRVVGVALDGLILTAVATLRIETIAAGLLPAAILLVVGAGWTMFAVLWVGRRLLPGRCWFELAVMNHGFATATTAQGMMLLRMVDPTLRSGAAPIYALAAPATAMFIGGGVLTYVIPILIHRGGVEAAVGVSAVAAAAAVGLYAAGRRLKSRE